MDMTDDLEVSGIKTVCDRENGENTCESMACAVETKYTKDFASISVSTGLIESHQHSNGFETDKQCFSAHYLDGDEEDIDRDRACCGEFPERYVYRPLGDIRQCCNGNVFNTLHLQCCPDNTLRSINLECL